MTSADDPEAHYVPPAQYLAPEVVLIEMAEAGAERSMSLSVGRSSSSAASPAGSSPSAHCSAP